MQDSIQSALLDGHITDSKSQIFAIEGESMSLGIGEIDSRSGSKDRQYITKGSQDLKIHQNQSSDSTKGIQSQLRNRVKASPSMQIMEGGIRVPALHNTASKFQQRSNLTFHGAGNNIPTKKNGAGGVRLDPIRGSQKAVTRKSEKLFKG